MSHTRASKSSKKGAGQPRSFVSSYARAESTLLAVLSGGVADWRAGGDSTRMPLSSCSCSGGVAGGSAAVEEDRYCLPKHQTGVVEASLLVGSGS